MTHDGTMTPVAVRVRGVHRETADTWTLELQPPAPLGAWDYRPGQFNMLYAFGIGEVPISVSGAPGRHPASHRARGRNGLKRPRALEAGRRGWPARAVWQRLADRRVGRAVTC